MPNVTKEQKQTWLTAMLTGAATALFIAIIFGGLNLWANDSRQDVKIGDNLNHAQRNTERIDMLTKELREEIRDLRTSMGQSDGELRALCLQILQEMKK